MALDFSGLADSRKDWRTESYSSEWAICCGAESAEAAIQDLEEGRTAEAIEKLLAAATWYGIGTGQYQLKDVKLYDRGLDAIRTAKNVPKTKDNRVHEQLRIAE